MLYFFVFFLVCVFLEMFQRKPIVVDLRGHIVGRAAALIAKELLCGQKIVCVRAELAELSGSLFRNKSLFSVTQCFSPLHSLQSFTFLL